MPDATAANQTWYRFMTAARTDFRAGRLTQALDGFNRAVAAIDAELEGAPPDATLLMAKVASHHNRAATLLRLGEIDQARADCHRVHVFVGAILDDPQTPEPLRVTACCLSRVTRAEWDQLRDRTCRANLPVQRDHAHLPAPPREGVGHVRH
jgi:hypothetical protein